MLSLGPSHVGRAVPVSARILRASVENLLEPPLLALVVRPVAVAVMAALVVAAVVSALRRVGAWGDRGAWRAPGLGAIWARAKAAWRLGLNIPFAATRL